MPESTIPDSRKRGASLDIKHTHTHTHKSTAKFFVTFFGLLKDQKGLTTSFCFTFFHLLYSINWSLFLNTFLGNCYRHFWGLSNFFNINVKIPLPPNAIETSYNFNFTFSLFFPIFTSGSFYLTFSISKPQDQAFSCVSTHHPLILAQNRNSIISNTVCAHSAFFLSTFPSVTDTCWTLLSPPQFRLVLKKKCTLLTPLSIAGYNLDLGLLRSVYFFQSYWNWIEHISLYEF